MNKHFRKFIALTMGCMIALGGAAFADSKPVQVDDGNIDMMIFDGLAIEEGYVQNIDQNVDELKEVYNLSEKDEKSVKAILESLQTLEKEYEKNEKAIQEKFEELIKIVAPYEAENLKNSDVLDWDEYLDQMDIEVSEVDSSDLEEAKKLYDILLEQQKSGDVETYWDTEEQICELLMDMEQDELNDETVMFEVDSTDELNDDTEMSEVDVILDVDESMIEALVENFNLDSLIDEYDLELSSADKALAESIVVEIQSCLDKKDNENAEKAFDKLEELLFGDDSIVSITNN